MEESPGLCVDPEEDEVFFYGVSGKEAEIQDVLGNKSVPTETEIVSKHRSEENNTISEVAQLNVLPVNHDNVEKTLVKMEERTCPHPPGNNIDVPVVDTEENLKMCQTASENPNVLSCESNFSEEILLDNNEKKEVNSTIISEPEPEVKKEIHTYELHETIHVDHNYSTPVKTIIDKSILKTPKSVVKADKDGGFLKVLSEIALVKAEVDETTPKVVTASFDISPSNEITNKNNKENDKSVQENSNVLIKGKEATPEKLFHNTSLEKLNIEKFNGNNFHKIDFENLKNCEEQNFDDDYKCDTTFDSNIIDNTKDKFCEMKTASTCKEISDDLHEVEVVFEKLTTVTNSVKTENPVQEEDVGNKVPQINVFDEGLPGKEEHSYSISPGTNMNVESDQHKKLLKRRTIRLLEELNEIVSHEQAKGESMTEGKGGLSEEAANVVQQLKAIAVDDSIISPDEYFDLDNLNVTLLGTEISDILNDALSKPLVLLTNKDMEMLLEKIGSASVEDKIQSPADVLDAEKENLCQNKIKETPSRNTENSKNTPMKFTNPGKLQKTPVSLNENIPPAQLRNQYKYTPTNKCLSEKKVYRPLILSHPNENKIRDCRTIDKAVKGNDTRIPKLTSTTSKIPVKGSRDLKMQSKNPTPNKTPYPKASKNLRFENIKSPIQAYINSKTPVLISNVKGKPDTGFAVWPRDSTSGTKVKKHEMETKTVINEPKTNLPFVKYRSAIPLKLEKAPESRLPRLAPKMQKLILGDSPIIAKHEGRIQVGAANRPLESMNESSIMLHPNEVSVIVRKFALKNNVGK